MALLVQEELKGAMDALVNDDAARAAEVWASDQSVDEVYNGIFREMLTFMMEDPRNITAATHLLFVAKNLERIGDHATNIAETVYYAVSGQPMPSERPKGDSSPFAVVRPPA
jgi:phosphate transport system protein